MERKGAFRIAMPDDDFSPDGKALAVGHDEVVDVWDLTKVKSAK